MTLSEEMLNANLSGYSEMLKKLDLKLGDIAISLTEISKASSKAKNGFATLLESFKAFEGVSKGFDTVSKAMGKTSDATKPLQQTFNSISEMSVKMRQGFNSVAVDMKNVFSNTSEINDMAKSLNGFGEQINETVTGIKSVSEAGKSLSGAFSISAISGYLSIVAAIIPIIQMIVEKIKSIPTPLKETTKDVEEQTQAWKDLREQQEEAIRDTSSTAGYYENLWTELSKTTEETERTALITSELSKYLGENITWTKEGIKVNGEFGISIDELMRKKKALLTLEALEPGYKEAIIQSGKNEATMRDILTQKIAAQSELESIINSNYYDPETKAFMIAQKAKEIGELDKLYSETEASYKEHKETMDQYEKLSIAASKGNYQEFEDMVDTINTGMLNASTASEDQLQTQYNTYFEAMQTVITNGKAYSKGQLNLLKENFSASAEELFESLMSTEEVTADTLTAAINKMGYTAEEANAILTSVLKEQGIEATDISEENGVAIIDGLVNTIVKQTTDSIPTIEESAAEPANVYEKRNEIKSPSDGNGVGSTSKVFARIGKSLISGLNTSVIDMTPETEEAIKGVSGAVTSAFDGVALPQLKGEFQSEAISNALAKIAGLFGFSAAPRLNIKKLAVGGLVEPGQLFLAREAGPELVGSYGSRSAVMNNNQIVESVSRGVYEAVRSAIPRKSADDNILNITVNLDGKQVYHAMEKYKRERGVELISGNLGYTY